MNGKPYCQRELKAMAGYVMQDDLLVPTMSGAQPWPQASEGRQGASRQFSRAL